MESSRPCAPRYHGGADSAKSARLRPDQDVLGIRAFAEAPARHVRDALNRARPFLDLRVVAVRGDGVEKAGQPLRRHGDASGDAELRPDDDLALPARALERVVEVQRQVLAERVLADDHDRRLVGPDFQRGRQVEVDAAGSPVKEMERKDPVAGHNMHLTIDLYLQQATERAMDRQIANGIGTHGIAAVAIDPNTGAVLAMASRPAYDPNWFTRGITEKEWSLINDNPNHPMENRVIAGEYPPGSTFKLITGSAALELKKVTPDEMIFDCGRHWLVDMRNAGGEALGWINFVEALAKSDNVYFYEMGRRVGIDELAKYARMFGMGKKTGIALRGEAPGLIASAEYKKKNFHDEWYLGDTFNSAIGQGFQLVTPLQAAMIVSEVANGGIQYRPFIVSRIDNLDGTPYKIFAPEQVGTLSVSKSTLDLVREGMRNVAEESGTAGSLFAGFPIQVAGKTGTAENFGGTDHGWFVAYAPYEHPRIVIAVLTEQGGFGSLSSGPIVRSMLEAYFHVGEYAEGAPKDKDKDGKEKDNKANKNAQDGKDSSHRDGTESDR